MKMTDVTILIPVYNEAEGLKNFLSHIISYARNYLGTHEVIVIDDGSTDSSVSIAETFPEVTLIRNPKNKGYGHALKQGFYHAKYECVVTIDADGTYPIEKISDLVCEFNKGYDLVIGGRTGAHYHKNGFQTFLRKVFKIMVWYITGEEILDPNSGLRIFRKSRLIPYIDSFCNGYSFSTTSTVILLLNGAHVSTVLIDYYFRVGKSKVRLARDALRTLQILISCFLNYNPIKVFLPLFVIWFGLGLFCVTFYFLHFLSPLFLTIGSILISFSFVFLSFGFIADIMVNSSQKVK